MVFLVRAKNDLSAPHAVGKVIKADDFWAWCDARETMDNAVRRHDEIVARAKAAYLVEQKRGYEEGSERAKLEYSGKMMELVTNTVEYFARVEHQMADLVIDAMRHIVHGFDDRERVLEAVRSCLAAVRSQKQLRLRVHPAQLNLVKSKLEQLLANYPQMNKVEVVGDKSLARDACAVESEIGTVEASISAQVEVLRDSLRRAFDAAPKPLPASPVQAMAVEFNPRKTMV
jgi:type III secretion protein L